MARDTFVQPSLATPFDNATNGFISTNAQEAIEEINNKVVNASKAFTFLSYNGNAGTGRYLEFFNGIDSSIAPIEVIGPLSIVAIVARTTAVNATCTIGFYNITAAPVLLYTVTFSAAKKVVLSGSPLFVVPALGQLAVKIDSGSIAKPHIYFTGQGG